MKKTFLFISFMLAINCNAQIIETKSSCDSNGDGIVNIEDVTNTINKVLGALTIEREVVDAADLKSVLQSLDNRLFIIEKQLGIMPASAKFEEIEIDGKVYNLGISGAIDLGLSVKWAAFNVGATSPSGYGDYYAWGETETYYTDGNSQTNPCDSWQTEKTGYDWDSYFDSSLTNYSVGQKTVLDLDDDVAHVKWRGIWRMPTQDEFEELYALKRNRIEYNGISGYIILGTNNNAIFLPSAGFRYKTNILSNGDASHYWSSSLKLSSTNSTVAYSIDLGDDILFLQDGVRYYGQSVRPVCE